MVKLSDDGQAVVQRFEEALEARLNRLVADWPPKKREAAADALLGLVQAIHEDMASEDTTSEDVDSRQTPVAAR